MRKGILIVLILVVPISFLPAQSEEDWYIGKPIEDIRFVGLENISENDLEGIIAPYIGKEFQNSLFFDLQSALFALDFFEEFVPQAVPADDTKTRVIIEFEVTERPVISEIVTEGNQSIRRTDILDAILLKVGDMVNNAKLTVDIESIRSLYLEKGYPDIDLDGRIERSEGTE
ncbi:MAG: outer membrane protein assembly factor BamA, partial [Spirochaetales bacterium]|nr:outer membrane protein assembly factor BamA [Spirochaetales bacterium]